MDASRDCLRRRVQLPVIPASQQIYDRIADLVIGSYAAGMPRAFTADEAAAIRAKLLAAGTESFCRGGKPRATRGGLAQADRRTQGAM